MTAPLPIRSRRQYARAAGGGVAEVAAIHARQFIGARTAQTEQPIFDFISALHRGSSHAEAEKLLNGVHHLVRARAYAAAVVLQDDRTPPEWRRIAMRMMFADERPYFASLPQVADPRQENQGSRDRIFNSNKHSGVSHHGACDRP